MEDDLGEDGTRQANRTDRTDGSAEQWLAVGGSVCVGHVCGPSGRRRVGGAGWTAPGGRCRVDGAELVAPGGWRRVGGAGWTAPGGRLRVGGSGWAAPSGRFRADSAAQGARGLCAGRILPTPAPNPPDQSAQSDQDTAGRRSL